MKLAETYLMLYYNFQLKSAAVFELPIRTDGCKKIPLEEMLNSQKVKSWTHCHPGQFGLPLCDEALLAIFVWQTPIREHSLTLSNLLR